MVSPSSGSALSAQPSALVLARRFLAFITVPYAALILAYILLRGLAAFGLPVSDTDGGLFGSFVGLSSSLMPSILLPSLPLVLLAALLRMPQLALLLAPVGVAFAALYGGLFLPRPAHSLTRTEPLVVYTHNLHVMVDDLDAATEAIRASGADVVALQELTDAAAAHLEIALADLYPYTALYSEGATTSGTGMLSRWPLRNVEVWRASMLQVRAVVERPGAPFAFYSLHPPPPHWFLRPFDTSDRANALTSALERAAGETLPVVLAGDFNLTDQTSDYQRLLAAGFTDSFRAAGWSLGLTFADFSYLWPLLSIAPPFIRIDYVFAGPGFLPLEATVGQSALGSDHYPVRAVLTTAP